MLPSAKGREAHETVASPVAVSLKDGEDDGGEDAWSSDEDDLQNEDEDSDGDDDVDVDDDDDEFEDSHLYSQRQASRWTTTAARVQMPQVIRLQCFANMTHFTHVSLTHAL